jgi:hypothetical protein
MCTVLSWLLSFFDIAFLYIVVCIHSGLHNFPCVMVWYFVKDCVTLHAPDSVTPIYVDCARHTKGRTSHSVAAVR